MAWYCWVSTPHGNAALQTRDVFQHQTSMTVVSLYGCELKLASLYQADLRFELE
eukprot:m.143815 g.143815  ORF g.143815 m.143815 type:complete len:54 (-) comp16177_c0_seq13:182-343(-)